MSKITYKLTARKQKVRTNRLVSSTASVFTLLLVAMFTIASGYSKTNLTSTLDNDPIVDTCENPLGISLGYNAFVRYGVTLNGGDTEGPIALGGDLTMDGIITIAAQTAGTNFFNGDDQASSLVVNGKIIYISGEGIHLNQGYAKVGDLSSSSVFDRDLNNASSNTRITSGLYNAKPRVQLQRKQNQNTVGQGGLIDFNAAFEMFERTSIAYSNLDATVVVSNDNKISLLQNEVNVLNITGTKLQNLPFLTFENKPNKYTPLIINVDASGDFEWNVLNLAGIGDQQGAFIIWNFYNASSITLRGGSTVVGSLFAPTSDVIKDSSGNINGQVIAANYYHRQGELHQHVFDSCTEEDLEECDLSVDLGEDQKICLGEEVVLTAVPSDMSDCEGCVGKYKLEDTDFCDADQSYVMYLAGIEDDGNKDRFFSNVDLEWNELDDGTTTLTGTILDYTFTQETYEVNAILSGKTIIAPANSPQEHRCNDEDATGWIYYTELVGTVTSNDGSWSIDITKSGPAFQLGNGANDAEAEPGNFGASGWFTTTDTNYTTGDFNIILGDCGATDTVSGASYLWSNGETTPSITVAPESDTVYTVTVTGCDECSATDEIFISVDSLIVDAGEDQIVCQGFGFEFLSKNGEEAILTASEGDSYLWSTGETTQSITVSPEETTIYGVSVTLNGCEGYDEVTVVVDTECDDNEEEEETANAISVYPTVANSNDIISIDYTSSVDQTVKITLFSTSGLNMVAPIEEKLSKGDNIIEFNLNTISQMKAGIYLLRISDANGDKVKKIVVE